MKGYRFYRDCGTKQEKRKFNAKDTRLGNVVVIDTEIGIQPGGCYEGSASLFSYEDSPVATTGVHLDYLSKCCIRVSESVARQIHPRLFEESF